MDVDEDMVKTIQIQLCGMKYVVCNNDDDVRMLQLECFILDGAFS